MFLVENLTKTYRHRRAPVHALDGVSFEVKKGDFVTVTGGSGSGKTTLLLSLGGLIHPTGGHVRVNGRSLYGTTSPELSQYRSRTVGFVLQTFHLVPYLSALENVMVPMLLSDLKNGAREAKAATLLEKLGLGDREDFLPRELSVGQQQRVAIARALANDPEVILADEPTGNLDPGLASEILEVLESLNTSEGRTVIMVTHSPAAAEFGSRRFHLTRGKLQECASAPPPSPKTPKKHLAEVQ